MKQIPRPQYDLYKRLHGLLEQVEDTFKPGAKVTLVIRNPMVADGDVILGNDDYDEAIAAIERMRNRPPVVKPGDEIEAQK